MNDRTPAKKPPALKLTSTAIEQVKQYRLSKEAVMDVMKNRTDTIKLDNGQFQFTGSDRYPNTYITAGFLPQKHQWVITHIQIMDVVSPPELEPSPPPKPEPPPKPVVKTDQRDTSPPAIIFTNHAKEILRSEFLDHRIVEHIIQYPDKKEYDDNEKIRFIGKSHGDKLHIIAKYLPKEHKWLVITIELRHKHEPVPLADISTFDGEPTEQHPGIMFTNHALERMALRSIFPDEVKQTIIYPRETFDDEEGKVKFIGKELTLNRAVHVIGRFVPEEDKWLVISTWVRGEEDDGSLSTWKPKHAKPSSGHARIAFTNHVREWMKRERVNARDIERAILDPYRTFKEEDNKVKFLGNRTTQGHAITVIGKLLPEEDKWLVITAWKSHQSRNNTSIVLIIIACVIALSLAGYVLYQL